MSKSQVESLLQQMRLSEPSSSLDQDIAETLRDAAMPTGNRFRLWSIVVATAVACLLLGVAVGRATVAPEYPSSDGFAEPARPKNEDIRLVRVTDVPSSLYGPKVTMLCAMTELETDGHKKTCVDCHSGLAAAESRFPKEHIKHPSFATCMFCHDRTESTDRPGLDHPRPF